MANHSNNKLVLLDDEVFSRIYTAGTSVKKFKHSLGMRNQDVDVMKLSEFVQRLVKSRSLPLEVNAKIVCGMGQILLQHSQEILAEVLAVQQRSSLNHRIGYGEKNVVRKLKVQLACKTGVVKNLAAPLDLDLEVVNFDVDIQEQITEKEVIYSLSCNDTTTVKNVEDITMRDDMQSECYGTQLQLTDDNDFGETLPSEMMDFLCFNDQLTEDSVAQIHPEPATLDDMRDIDLSVDADFDMPNTSSYTEQALEDTLEPLPLETLYDKDTYTCEDPVHEDGDNAHNLLVEHVVEKQNTLIEKCKMGQKRRLIIDAFTQINSKYFHRALSDPSISIRPRPSCQELLAEHRLHSLFTKPLRDCCNSSKFDRKVQPSRKRNQGFDDYHDLGKKRRHHMNELTVNKESTVQIGGKQQNVLDLAPEQSCRNPHIASFGPMKSSDMKIFLASFTGTQSQWAILQSCEPSSSGVKQNKNDQSVVSQYAVKTLLDAMFAESTDDSIPFKLLQTKMGNRLIAATFFAKLLELSKDKIIRVSSDENRTPVSVHKYINWK
ncbi:uncharacterized protein LOC128302204 [Anopheles moucheti]|uniref:uncharacterized protein LOC128302204 n=1 Tax=Anopheles moucheti TaxID=186751 RepID=UPI0022F01FD5|nr:uncharacterized protein LOC128302204 [Anopheles moucheti]